MEIIVRYAQTYENGAVFGAAGEGDLKFRQDYQLMPVPCLQYSGHGPLPPIRFLACMADGKLCGNFTVAEGYPTPQHVYISGFWLPLCTWEPHRVKNFVTALDKFYSQPELNFEQIMLTLPQQDLSALAFWYQCGFTQVAGITETERRVYVEKCVNLTWNK